MRPTMRYLVARMPPMERLGVAEPESGVVPRPMPGGVCMPGTGVAWETGSTWGVGAGVERVMGSGVAREVGGGVTRLTALPGVCPAGLEGASFGSDGPAGVALGEGCGA